jgi:hypothetical protein
MYKFGSQDYSLQDGDNVVLYIGITHLPTKMLIHNPS